jgi:hypothetical protein
LIGGVHSNCSIKKENSYGSRGLFPSALFIGDICLHPTSHIARFVFQEQASIKTRHHKSEDHPFVNTDQKNNYTMFQSNFTTRKSLAKRRFKTKNNNKKRDKRLDQFVTTPPHPSEKYYEKGDTLMDKTGGILANYVDLDKINELKIGIDST